MLLAVVLEPAPLHLACASEHFSVMCYRVCPAFKGNATDFSFTCLPSIHGYYMIVIIIL